MRWTPNAHSHSTECFHRKLLLWQNFRLFVRENPLPAILGSSSLLCTLHDKWPEVEARLFSLTPSSPISWYFLRKYQQWNDESTMYDFVWWCPNQWHSMALDGIRWHATDDNKCQHCFAAAKQSPFAPPLAVNVTAGPKNTAEATRTGSADVWQPARNLVLEWRAYKLRMLVGVWSPFMPFIPRQCWWLMAKIQTHNFSLGFCKLHGLSFPQWCSDGNGWDGQGKNTSWIFVIWGWNTNHNESHFKCHVMDKVWSWENDMIHLT